jgi:hypothetical protein
LTVRVGARVRVRAWASGSCGQTRRRPTQWATSMTYGCSLYDIWLQPLSHMVAASDQEASHSMALAVEHATDGPPGTVVSMPLP